MTVFFQFFPCVSHDSYFADQCSIIEQNNSKDGHQYDKLFGGITDKFYF